LHLQDLSENVQAKLNQVNAVQSALNSKASTSSVDASFASVTRSIADKATTTIVDASFASVTSAVATKASTTIVDASFASVTSAIALKASTTIVDASFASVTSAIANKATTTIVDASFASVTSAIALKATKSIVDASFASVNSAIDLKATKSIVDASFTSVNSSIDLKATKSIVDASFTSVNSAVALKANLASPALTGVPTAPTATAGTNTTQLATTAFVKSAVDNLVASAPAALDTLNELAAALGNDAAFSTTVTNSLASKAPLANPTFTGTVTASKVSISSDASFSGRVDVCGNFYANYPDSSIPQSAIVGGISSAAIVDLTSNQTISGVKTFSTQLNIGTNTLTPLAILAVSQMGSNLVGRTVVVQAGASVALNDAGTIIAIGCPNDYMYGNYSGSVRVYQWSGSAWSQLGADIMGTRENNTLGYSVSLSSSGLILAIGGPNISTTRVYQYVSNAWTQLGADIVGTGGAGSSVSISADGMTVAIGAPQANASSGQTRVYKYISSTWTQLGQDIASEAAGDWSGVSVALSADGTTVVIGANYNMGAPGDMSGHARVYKYANSTWTQLGQDLDGEASYDMSGWSVAISDDGTIVAIGAPRNTTGATTYNGQVRVYQYANSTWTKLGQDIDGRAIWAQSGSTVSLSADGYTVAIGADSATGLGGEANRGYATLYKYDGTIWKQLGTYLEGQAAGDKFGTSVALSADGTTLAAGAPFANSSDGFVKVYKIQNASSKIIVSNGFDICGNLYAQYPASSIPLTAISANLATLSYVDSSLNSKASLAAPTFTGTVVSSGDLALNSKLRVSGDASFNGRVDICGNFYAKYPASSIPVSAIAASLATVAAVDTSLNLKASVAAPTFTGTVVSSGDLSLNSKLRVSGDASFNGRVDICGNFYAKYPASSIPASAIVGVSDTLSVTNINISGNVGIGTTTPQAPLQVVGNSKIGSLSLTTISAQTGLVYDSSWSQVGNTIQGRWWDLSGVLSASYAGWSTAINGDGTIMAHGSSTNYVNIFKYRTITLAEWNLVSTTNRTMPVAKHPDTVYDSTKKYWVQMGNSIIDGVGVDDHYDAVSLNEAGDTIVIGAAWDDTGGSNMGTCKVFKYDSATGAWNQVGQNIYGSVANEYFGGVVDINAAGNIIAVGGQLFNSYSGRAVVYRYDSATNLWNQIGQTFTGGKVGASLSLSSDGYTVAIAHADTMIARIYTYSSGTNLFVQNGGNIVSEVTNDRNASSVSLSADGTMVAVGASWANSQAGQARVYEYRFATAEEWAEVSTTLRSGVVVKNGDTTLNATKKYWVQIGNDVNGNGGRSGIGVSLRKHSVHGTTLAMMSTGSVRLFKYRQITQSEWNTSTLMKGNDTVYSSTKSYWIQLGYDKSISAAGGISTALDLNSDGTVLTFGSPTSTNYLNQVNGGLIYVFSTPYVATNYQNDSIIDTLDNNARRNLILNNTLSIDPSGVTTIAGRIDICGNLYAKYPDASIPASAINGVSSNVQTALNLKSDLTYVDASLNLKANLVSPTFTGPFVVASGDVSMNNNLRLGGDLIVKGNLSVFRQETNSIINTTINNYEIVITKDISLNGNLVIANNASLNSKLFVSDDVSLNNKLFVNGNATLNSKLSVANDASFNGRVDICGNLYAQYPNSSIPVSAITDGVTLSYVDASLNLKSDITYVDASLNLKSDLTYVDASLNLKSDLTYVDTALNLKSNLTYVDASLNLKSNLTYVDASLNLKSNLTYVDASLNLKSNLTYVDASLNLKSNITYVDASLNLKSDRTYVDTALNLKSNLTYVDASLNLKSDRTYVDTALNLKSNLTYVDTSLNLKSDRTYVDTALNLKSNLTYVDTSLNLKANQTYVDTALNLKANLASPTFTGIPNAPTASYDNSSNQVATTGFVQGRISSIINSAPAALDTLNELAAALGNDSNYAATVTNSLSQKANITDVNSALALKSNLTYVDASLNLKSDITYVDTALNLKSNLTYVDASLNLKSNITYVDTALNLKSNLAYVDSSLNLKSNLTYVDSSLNVKPSFSQVDSSLNLKSNLAYVDASLNLKANATDVNSALALKATIASVDASLNLKSNITYVDASLNLKSAVTYVDTSLNLKANLASPTFTGIPNAPTASYDNSSNQVATTGFVQGRISAIINSAPAALDTLNELAAALGNDANYAATVTNSLSQKANITDVNSALALKATTTIVDASLNLKANTTDVNSALALKAPIVAVDASLNLKSNITYVDASLNLKSAVTYVDSSLNLKANTTDVNSALALKAPIASVDASLNLKSNITYVDASLNLKANATDVNSALALKAPIASVDASLNLKSNITYVDASLNVKPSFSQVDASLNLKSAVTYVDASLNLKATLASPTFTGTPNAPTASYDNSSNQIATTGFVQGRISAIINSAPAALDTLNELAAALGNDANYAATVTNSLSQKANITDVNSSLALKATITAVDASLNLKSNITYVDAALAAKPSFSQVDASLNLKSAITYVDASLNAKPSFSQVDASLNTKSAVTYVDASLNLKSNVAYVDASLNAKPSFSQVDASLNLKSAITYVDASLNAKPSFSQVDASLNLKSAVTYVDASLNLKATLASPTFTGTPNAPTAAYDNSSNQIATTGFVQGRISSIINSAPAALDTLNELAAALGNDANYAATVTNLLSQKANATDVNSTLVLKATITAVDASLNLKSNITYVDAALNAKPNFSQVDASLNLKSNITYVDTALNAKPSFSQVDASLNLKSNITYVDTALNAKPSFSQVDASLNLKSAVTYVDAALAAKPSFSQVDASLNLKSAVTYVDASLNLKSNITYVDAALNAKPSFSQVDASLNLRSAVTYVDASLNAKPSFSQVDASLNLRSAVTYVDASLNLKANLVSPTFTGTPNAPTAAYDNSSNQIATTGFVQGRISSIINSAPAALDTLNELAAALGNDANYAATVTNTLSQKANSTDVTSALALKATITAVDASLNLKSNITYVDAALTAKPSFSQVDASLNLKSNITYVDAALTAKPSFSQVDASLNLKSAVTYVDASLNLKSNITYVDAALTAKPNFSQVDASLNLKPSFSQVDASLNLKPSFSQVDASLNLKSAITYVDASLNLKATLASPTFTGTPNAPTASYDNSSNQIATTGFVQGRISSIINSAPAALDTLNELAAALGNDANYAATVTNTLSQKANATDVTSALALKATIAAVDASLNLKSNITYVDAALTAKPSFSQVDASLNLKSNITYVDAALTAKPSFSQVDASLNLKANITYVDASLNLKSDRTYVDAALTAKPSFSQVDASLNLKSNITYVDASLNMKSDRTYVDAALTAKPSFSQVDVSLNAKPSFSQVDVSLNAKPSFSQVDVSLNAKPSFSQVDASLNLKSDRTYVDSSLNTKPSFSQVDASLNLKANATSPTFTGILTAAKLISGDASFNGNLDISGVLSVTQTVNSVVKNTTINNYNVSVTNDLSLNGKLVVSSDVSMNSKLYVKGDASFGRVDICGNFYAQYPNNSIPSSAISNGVTLSYVDASLNLKSAVTYVDASLNLKSSVTYVDAALNLKPSFSQVDSSLNLKSNLTYVDAALTAKPSFSQVDASLNLKPSVTYVDAALTAKPNFSQVDASLNLKSNITYVDASLNLKSNITYVDAALNAKPNFSQVDASLNLKSNLTYVDSSLNLKANLVSPTFTGIPNAPTASYDNSSNQIATTGFVQGRISSIINSAPAALDTLNELAAALGNDANYAATVTNTLSQKANITDVNTALALKPSFSQIDASLNLKPSFSQIDASLNAKPSFLQVDASLNLKPNFSQVDASLNLKSAVTYVDASLNLKSTVTYVDASLNLKPSFSQVDASLNAKPSFSQVDASLNLKPSFSQVDASLNLKSNLTYVDASLSLKPSFSQVDASLNLKPSFSQIDASLNLKSAVTYVDASLNLKANLASPTFTGTPNAPTAAYDNSSNQIATTGFVQGRISAIINSAPAALDTLNELAAALGNDANYAATVTNSLSQKANITDVNNSLALKPSFSQVDASLNLKPTFAQVDASLNLKPTFAQVDASLNSIINSSQIDASLNLKPSFSQVDASLNLKSNVAYVDASLNLKSAVTYVDASLNLKSAVTYVDASLNLKPSFSQVDSSLNLKSAVTYVDASLNLKANLASPTFTGTPNAPTAAYDNSSNQIATTGFVQGRISAIINSAPAALDTLNELAAALGNDANYASTVTNLLSQKANATDLNSALALKPSFSQVDASLNLKPSFSQIDASLNLKPSFSQVDASLNLKAAVTYVDSSLSLKPSFSQVDTSLNLKAAVTYVDSSLSLKPSFSQVDSSLNLKPTFAQVDASLNAILNFSQVDASLNLKPSFSQVDASLNLKSAVTYVDASLNLKSAVTYVDASLNLKSAVTYVDSSLNLKANLASPTFTGIPNAPTAAYDNSSNQIATTGFVQGRISSIINSAPAALDTLNELAAALGNDANYAATVTNTLSQKANTTDVNAALALKPTFAQVDASLNLKPTSAQVDASLNLKPTFAQVDASLNLKPTFAQVDASLNAILNFSQVDASLNLKSNLTYVDASLNLKSNLTYVDASLNLKPRFAQVDASLNLKPNFVQVDASLNLKPSFVQVDVSLNLKPSFSQVDSSLNLKPSFSQVDSSLNLKANVASPTFTGVVTAPKLTSGDASFNGNIDISGVLSVTQTVNSVVKNTTINNYNVAVTNDLSLNGKLIVSSDVSLNSKLFVKGDASFNGRVDICGNFYANYPANSIPSSAIIGGVGGGSTSGVDISSNQTISGVKTFANGLNVGNTLVSSVAAALAFDPSFQRIKIGQDIDGETADDQSGFAVSLSSDGTIIAIGARFNDGTTINAGQVRVYKNISGTWTKLGQDIDGEDTPDQSGYSVSLSADGTIVAIGAIYNDGGGADSGHVRVYKYNGSTTWTQLGQDINGEATTDWSGYSVSLSSDGTIVAIGSWYNNGVNGSDSGHVRIYKYDGSTTWTKLGQDIDGEAANDQSGFSVSLSSNGQIVAIGARYNAGTVAASYRGQVRVYQYNGTTTWTQIGQDIDGEASQDNSGWSVSLSSDGTIVAIGAVNNDGTTGTSTDNRGSIRVYKNISGTWTQLGQDIDGEAAGDNSGFSISLNGDGTVIAIGAYLNDGTGSNSGHVRIYQFISNTWQQLGSDVDGEAAGDQSGYSVSLSRDGTMLAVGANQNDGANGVDSGHVRVYQIRSAIASSTKLTIGNNVDICGNFYAQYAAASIPASAINGISSAIQTAIDLKATKTIVDASFTSVNSAIALKANLASPALTGVPTAPTASAGTNTTQLATTEFTTTAVSTKANLASPALTGVPTAPTASAGTNTTQLATTAFVKSAVDNLVASAPAALDTLNELAAALGSDASFSTTVTNSLASKAPLANPTFTGTINASKVSISSDASFNGRVDICGNFYAKYPASSIPASAIIGGVGGGGSFDPNTDLSLNQKLAVGGDVSLNSNVDIGGNLKIGTQIPFTVDPSGQWSQIGSSINGQSAPEWFGAGDGVDMNADGTIIIVGGNRFSSNTGRAFVYKYINSAWTQLGQTIVGSGTNVYCGAYTAINAAGDIIAVSSTYTDVTYTDSGSVTVYKYNTGSSLWVQLGQTLNGPAINAHFGNEIELNADGYTIVIGNADLNQCFVYRYNGTSTWNQLGNTIAGATGDVIGLTVDINEAGDIVALGTLPTTIKIYSLVGSTWTILGNVITTGAATGRYDKLALSSDGYTVIAGDEANNAALVYKYNGTTWVQRGQKILGPDSIGGFGGDVAINSDGTVVAAGSRMSVSAKGQAFAYWYNGSAWVQLGQTIDGIATGDRCGETVSLSKSGTVFAVGSSLYGGGLGQVRIFSIPYTAAVSSGKLAVNCDTSFNSRVDICGNFYAQYPAASIPASAINGIALKADLASPTFTGNVVASKMRVTSDASFNGRVDICGNFYAQYPASSIPSSAIIGGVGGGSSINLAADISVNGITVGRGGGDSNFSTVLGLSALGRNTGGYMNVAVGCTTLFSNLTGNQNVAMNFSALYSNTSGSDNIAIGKQAITTNQTGSNNVGIGSLAIQGITSSNNTAVGHRSLVYSSTGSSNTAFGYLAGQNNSSGSFNTYIGYGADLPAYGATWSNSTAIGANAMITASNQITLGTAAERVFMPGKLTTSGDASFNGRVDISGNATASKMRVTSDASFNGRVDICGNFYAQYPASSIPQSAIIGGVGGGSSVVDLTTSQTITGTKTFSNQINIGSNAITQLATLAVAQLGTNLLGRLPSLSGSATALNDAGTIVAVGSPGDSNYRGAVRMYQWSGTAWTQLGQDILSTTDGTQMGCAVSLSSTGLFLAAGGLNRVRIYQYSNSTWSQLGADIIDAAGSSISISSDGMTFASGNPGAYINGGENTGRTRIYKYINSTWTQLGQDLLGEAASNRSGFSLALSADGTIVVIGAHYNDGTNSNGTIRYMSGHARIYKYANSTWTQLGQDIDGEVSYDMSGWSVDISQDGTIVAIGAPRNTTGATTYNGQARIYKYANSTWTQVGQDIDGRAIWAQSGSTVSLSADGYTVAIGSSFATGLGGETDRGYAVVYKYNGTTWSMVGSYIEGQAAGDQFGFSLALSADGTILSVGSPYNNSNAGNVKVYKIQTASSKIIVSDGVDICGNLYAKQLQLSSNATFNGRVDISGNLYANSLQLTSSATFNGRVDICGNFYAQYPPNSIPASAIIGGVGSSSGSSGSSTGANVTFTDSFALIKEAVVVDPASVLLRQF
jgi:hypothetical protein